MRLKLPWAVIINYPFPPCCNPGKVWHSSWNQIYYVNNKIGTKKEISDLAAVLLENKNASSSSFRWWHCGGKRRLYFAAAGGGACCSIDETLFYPWPLSMQLVILAIGLDKWLFRRVALWLSSLEIIDPHTGIQGLGCQIIRVDKI